MWMAPYGFTTNILIMASMIKMKIKCKILDTRSTLIGATQLHALFISTRTQGSALEIFYIQSFSLTECIGIVWVRKIPGLSVCLCVCLSVCVSVCVSV